MIKLVNFRVTSFPCGRTGAKNTCFLSCDPCQRGQSLLAKRLHRSHRAFSEPQVLFAATGTTWRPPGPQTETTAQVDLFIHRDAATAPAAPRGGTDRGAELGDGPGAGRASALR